MYEQVILRA